VRKGEEINQENKKKVPRSLENALRKPKVRGGTSGLPLYQPHTSEVPELSNQKRPFNFEKSRHGKKMVKKGKSKEN